MTNVGKVYLVGAGPGHPDLLTIRAAKLLRTAEVIVYDRLIQDEVLALAKPSAERIFMGKPLGRHGSRQDEIHDLLVRKAREGRTVVRLKGGDPFLFGRGGEEAEYLAEHGIPFEVVPGVSSCLSAPLSAGIAVTHRDRASSVAIVTGHQAAEHDDRVDWQALSKVDTLVVLMGIHNLQHITSKLMAAGLAPDTPTAIVQMAFWESERVITSTLGGIAGEARHAAIEPPATLVIGEAVRLRDKLKHHQQHMGRHTGGDPLTHAVPIAVTITDRPAGDTLSLEEASCISAATCEKDVLQ
jgi:uroporphyrin-III C-methyltransferase